MTTPDAAALARSVVIHAVQNSKLWSVVYEADPDCSMMHPSGATYRSNAMNAAMLSLSHELDNLGKGVEFSKHIDAWHNAMNAMNAMNALPSSTYVLAVYGALLAYLHPVEFVALRDMDPDGLNAIAAMGSPLALVMRPVAAALRSAP